MADSSLVSFPHFLDQLARALESRAIDGPPLSVAFDPARREPAEADEILVGIGHWMDQGNPVQHQGAVLNNKGAAQRFGWKRDPATVAALVRDLPEDVITGWRRRFSSDPATTLERAALIVEDASPDSILSVVFLLARLAGVAPPDLPHRWLTALTVWERDGIAPSVTRSWTALLSALSHSHFGAGYDAEPLAAAWIESLQFTASLLLAGSDPDGVDPETSPAILADPAYGRAIAFAMNEKQDYLQSLARAVKLELLVPMAGSPGRDLLVDAYFAVEANAPSGVKKIFIRTDAQHTTLGNGFSLMGLNRPGSVGTGNDMTISVDPRAGIALKDLWQALEAMENERWAGQRPFGSPRRIASYADRQGFDQPWWDDHGRYTLLGAPKRVGPQELGSKLDWTDVLEAVWRCYNQLRQIDVVDLNAGPAAGPRPVEQAGALTITSGSGLSAVTSHLIALKWDMTANAGQSLQFTATVKRHLASLIIRAAAGSQAPIRLSDLTDPADFDFLELAGGAAIVLREGALLFDDWRDRALPTTQLSADFSQALDLLAASKAFDAEVDALYGAATAGGGLFKSGTSDVLRKITSLRARIAHTFQRSNLPEASPDRRALRAALERHWSLENKEAALTGRLKDLQEILETKATLDTQGMAQLIGFVSIPAFVAGLMQLYASVIANKTPEADGSQYGSAYLVAITLAVLVFSVLALAVAFLVTRQKD